MPTRLLKKRGAPSPSKSTATRVLRSPVVALTVKVDRRTYQALDRLRQQQHRTMQELLSEAVEMSLAEEGPPAFSPASEYEYEPEPPLARRERKEDYRERDEDPYERRERAAAYDHRERLIVEPIGRRARAEADWAPPRLAEPQPVVAETPWTIKAVLAAAVLAFLIYSVQAVERISGFTMPLWQAAGLVLIGLSCVGLIMATRRVKRLRDGA